MRPLVGPVPDPAERACSALRRCARTTLTLGAAVHAVPVVHPLEGDAGLAVLVPTDPRTGGAPAMGARTADAGSAGGPGPRARLEVLDVVLGGAADGRCRRLVVVEGDLTVPARTDQRRLATDIARDLPAPALLDVGTSAALVLLRPARIVLTDHDGVTTVDPEDLATSGPDPFADLEGHWLAHLNDPRCPVLDRIAARLGRCAPGTRPLLVGIDRVGLDLEVAGVDGAVAHRRVPFAEACVGVTDLGAQIRVLAGCPRSAAPLAGRDGAGAGADRWPQNPAATGGATPGE